MRSNRNQIIFTLLLLGFFLLPGIALDAAPGKIIGKVFDKATQESLPGCNIIFKGTSIGTISNFVGDFSFLNVDEGTYTLLVSFLGYQEQEVVVEVMTGANTLIRIELEYETIQGEEAVVYAQARGQMKAINQQLSAISVKSIVSEARIKELPDANAAEALGRLPGVTVNRSGGEATSVNVRGQSGGSNTYYVEGMRMVGAGGRGVSLSNIATSMIGGIEVQKSFTPDNDGDVSGGGITFKLKKAEDEKFHADLFLKQGYNGLTKSYGMRDASLTLSKRFFNNRFGLVVNGVLDQKDRSLDFMEGSYEDISKPITSDDLPGVKPFSGSFNRRYEYIKRWGLTYNMDYSVPNHRISFSGFLAGYTKDSETYQNSIQKTPQGVRYNGTKYLEETASNILGLTGEHNVWGFKIDWSASYSYSDIIRPSEYSINTWNNQFSIGSGWENATSISEVFNGIADQHNLLETDMSETGYGKQQKDAAEGGARVDIEKQFTLTQAITGFLKFGGKYRNTSRSFEEFDSRCAYGTPRLHAIEGALLLDTLYGELDLVTTSRNILSYQIFGRDERIPMTIGDVDLVYPVDFNILVPGIDATYQEYMVNLDNKSYNYDNTEILSAAYAMAQVNIGKYLTFIPGVRFESFRSSTDAYAYVADPSRIGAKMAGDVTPVSSTNENDLWLPMFTLKFKPLNWLDIRASVTKTLQRPTFESMSPRLSETADFHRSYGNPDLQPAVSQNYDLYFSFYENHLGLFTIGGFHKDIDDEIVAVDMIITDTEELGLPDKYLYKTFSTYENNEYYSYIQGIEIDWQTRFWYLPSFLDGFIFYINYTFLKSESKRRFFYEDSRELPVPPYRETVFIDSFRVNSVLGTPDQTLKFSLGYEKRGFSGRVSLFYQALAMSWVSPYRNWDEATEALYKWDMQLSQQLFKGFKVYLNIANLTSWPDVVSKYYFPKSKTSIQNYGWSMDIGLRYQF